MSALEVRVEAALATLTRARGASGSGWYVQRGMTPGTIDVLWLIDGRADRRGRQDGLLAVVDALAGVAHRNLTGRGPDGRPVCVVASLIEPVAASATVTGTEVPA